MKGNYILYFPCYSSPSVVTQHLHKVTIIILKVDTLSKSMIKSSIQCLASIPHYVLWLKFFLRGKTTQETKVTVQRESLVTLDFHLFEFLRLKVNIKFKVVLRSITGINCTEFIYICNQKILKVYSLHESKLFISQFCNVDTSMYLFHNLCL